MVQHIIRALLVLALLVVGINVVEKGNFLPEYGVVLIIGALILAVAIIAVDLMIPRKSLQALAGIFLGLSVGLLLAYGLTFVINQLVLTFAPVALGPVAGGDHPLVAITKVLVGIICCYFCISFVMQTKDDVRFVIPYVEFAKQLKGQHPIILDTSVIIDGRIVDICETGIIDQKLIVPRFVLRELQGLTTCGRIESGFVKQVCSACAFQRIIGLPCGGRGICPSCMGRTMVEGAARLVDHILPAVPLRQYVLTLPYFWLFPTFPTG